MIQLFRPVYDVDECLKNLKEVLESGWTGQGPKCQEFEKIFGEYIGNPNCHFLNSATAALHIALRLCDLPVRSKVVTTPITFCSTNHVILYENHIPVFADINQEDLCLSSDSVIENVLKYNARAVIWVHYSGHVSNEFFAFMKWRNKVMPHLKVIEDCAHASGSSYSVSTFIDGYRIEDIYRRVGSRTDTFACFSFQAVKNLNTADSGMIVCPDQETLDRAKKLSWLGIDKSTYTRTGSKMGDELYKWKYDIQEVGWKYNGNDVMAAIALAQLKHLDEHNSKRRTNYLNYLRNFKNHHNVKLVKQNDLSSHHLCVVLVNNREKVMASLKDAGFAPGVHYLPNYEFPVFARFYHKGDCPSTEEIAEKILTLPNHLQLTDEHIDRISEVVIKNSQC